MILPILQSPDERLRLISEVVVEPRFESFKRFVVDLRETFAATPNCIGLAAIQLGLPLRVIIVDVTPSRCDTYLMINPEIVNPSDKLQLVNDGCMSVKHGRFRSQTKRPKRLGVTWIDENCDRRHQKFSGLIAACIHHEVDHLNGILFTDRINHDRRHSHLLLERYWNDYQAVATTRRRLRPSR